MQCRKPPLPALTVKLSKYNVDDVALGVCKTGAEEAGVTEVRTSLSEKKRSEERFSRNAETDLVCRLLLEKKKYSRNSDHRADGLHRADALLAGTHHYNSDNDHPTPLYTIILRLLPPIIHLFFFNDPATTEIYTLSLHDALPIYYQNITLTI